MASYFSYLGDKLSKYPLEICLAYDNNFRHYMARYQKRKWEDPVIQLESSTFHVSGLLTSPVMSKPEPARLTTTRGPEVCRNFNDKMPWTEEQNHIKVSFPPMVKQSHFLYNFRVPVVPARKRFKIGTYLPQQSLKSVATTSRLQSMMAPQTLSSFRMGGQAISVPVDISIGMLISKFDTSLKIWQPSMATNDQQI